MESITNQRDSETSVQATTINADTERAARAFLAKAAQQYDLVGALLFGSQARGDHRPDSDVDIAVLLRGPRGNFLDTKLALADIAYEVLLETGILIQPLPIWDEEWEHPERSPNPELLRNIDRDGVRL
ncbi:MAG: nucleotidyltransferase domain-containing protein [Thermoleophilia bacterium]|nr:nucleotidyltransferase domain-containing protein [Thermoleophilia bacterium]